MRSLPLIVCSHVAVRHTRLYSLSECIGINAYLLCVQDEPTSHLDMLSIGSLMACLQAYSGAIVLVSHDQHIVAGMASEVSHSLKYFLLIAFLLR